MKTIYKYPIGPGTQNLVLLSPNALVLSVLMQGDDLVLYAEVDDDKPATELHTIYVYGTGWPIAHNGGNTKFVGTVQAPMGIVWHVYRSR